MRRLFIIGILFSSFLALNAEAGVAPDASAAPAAKADISGAQDAAADTDANVVPDVAANTNVPGFLGLNGDGVYLGIAVGYHSTPVEMRVTASGVTAAPLNDGVMGGAYLGYALGLSQHFLLSLEINANLFSSQNLSQTVGTQTVTKAAIENNYGVNVMPGVAIGKRSQMYLSVGVESGRLRVETNSAGSNYKFNKRLYGMDLGGGYAVRVAKRFSLRLAYQHVWYFEKSQTFAAAGVTNHFTPQDNRVVLGAAYHFIA